MSGIKDFDWNFAAIDYLVYSEDRKSLLLTFVDHHKSTSKRSDDVIAGKGILRMMKLKAHHCY